MTFHGAGDPSIARDLLGVDDFRDARITVMVVGSWLDATPELVSGFWPLGTNGATTRCHTRC